MTVRESHVTVLFSGGTDSTLAAARMLDQFERVTLLTLDPGYLLFMRNVGVHGHALRSHYGEKRVDHVILPMKQISRQILWGEISQDVRRYGFNMAALVCLGCRLSMHTAAIIYNLEQGIPFIADGSIAAQNAIPEQMQSTLARNREHYLRTFGIWHYAPIYDETSSDKALEELGIARQKGLKKQFILFDTQYTCPFGVPADVYARMFYKPLMEKSRERDSAEYSQRKYPDMESVVRGHFDRMGASADQIIERLRTFHAERGTAQLTDEPAA